MRYFDAFSGTGSYEDGHQISTFDHSQPCKFCSNVDCDDKNCKNCQICKTGTPIIAIQAALVHMEVLKKRSSFKDRLKEAGSTCLRAVEFIFNDFEESYIVELYSKISRCFNALDWQEDVLDPESCPVTSSRIFKSIELTGPFLTIRQCFRIHFTIDKFENVKFKPEPEPGVPLFSLIDPFGVAQIPMTAVRPLVSDNRTVLLNLMVAALDK